MLGQEDVKEEVETVRMAPYNLLQGVQIQRRYPLSHTPMTTITDLGLLAPAQPMGVLFARVLFVRVSLVWGEELISQRPPEHGREKETIFFSSNLLLRIFQGKNLIP